MQKAISDIQSYEGVERIKALEELLEEMKPVEGLLAKETTLMFEQALEQAKQDCKGDEDGEEDDDGGMDEDVEMDDDGETD